MLLIYIHLSFDGTFAPKKDGSCLKRVDGTRKEDEDIPNGIDNKLNTFLKKILLEF